MVQEANTADVPFGPWTCCARPPGSVTHPDQLRDADHAWLPAVVPGTVAEALHAQGTWDFSRPVDLDASDWWYRTTFAVPDAPAGWPCHLCLDGLATLAEVWLNGRLLLSADNMFRAYRLDVGPHLRPHNELVLGFRSLAEDLKRKRPRPRWKTNLVNHQQLRWQRTSLLGRMPGWTPPAPVVGPWRAVRLDHGPCVVSDLRLSSRMEGEDGVVTVEARVHAAAAPGRVTLNVAGDEAAAQVRPDGGAWLVRAALRIARPALWWPHSHGEQPLYDCALHLDTGRGRVIVSCPAVGFRHLEVRQEDGLAVQVNGVKVYCRGACWTVSDVLSPGGAQPSLDQDLRLARAGGANMLRVAGTMVYESDRFYRLCDELGILVWQDFMFASMDYPVDEPAFRANAEAEANHQLARLAAHPCLAVLCGNAEVEQQAAMRGVPREQFCNAWFGGGLPELCAAHCPDVAYVPSSPSGGDLPFHVRQGVAQYFGVGAYLRPPEDVRRADVGFASECLAFSNVPEPATVNALLGGASPAPHHPLWKQRVPRDVGAGWDFEDVRDFYLRHLSGVDPVRLRSFDVERYLQLGRAASGEMMAQVFAEWRGGHSRNRGGLVLCFKDLWPGAGWGIVDSLGVPKAAYYYLRRSWQPRQVSVTDEGLDGLHLHVTNETAAPLNGFVELLLLKDGHITVARAEAACTLPAWGRQTFASDALLDGFRDVTYAYRFGPPGHDLAVATLYDDQHHVLSEAFHFVQAREPAFLAAVSVDTEAELLDRGLYRVALRSDRFLHGVSFDAPGFLPDDNWFHLVPNRPKTVLLTARQEGGVRFRAGVEALNLQTPIAVRVKGGP
jgi:beta-mannosidase